MEIEVVVAAGDILGEGVVWSPRSGAVHWTDIVGKRLWTFHPGTREATIEELPDRLTCLAPMQDGRLLAGFADGLAIYANGRSVIEVPIDVENEEGESLQLPAAGEDPFEHASSHQFGQRLGAVLQSLSGAERCAFVLRHFEQYPLEEIAGELGCNVNACKQTVFRAVRKLRTALSPARSET